MSGRECFRAHPRPCIKCEFYRADYSECRYKGLDNLVVDTRVGVRARVCSAGDSRRDESACGFEGRWFSPLGETLIDRMRRALR